MKKNTDHKNFLLISFIFSLLSLILFSCTQPNPQNPFDPDSGTDLPEPVITNVEVIEYIKLNIEWYSNYT
jgi:hypothetical protein